MPKGWVGEAVLYDLYKGRVGDSYGLLEYSKSDTGFRDHALCPFQGWSMNPGSTKFLQTCPLRLPKFAICLFWDEEGQ